ncbi:MAG: gliding motility-associated C-terminal domain-containing protein [Elusimicrobiota bacterium]
MRYIIMFVMVAMLFPAMAAVDGLEIKSIHSRTFSPNNDGYNDRLIIVYDNPLEELVSGKIYDIRGAYVADMEGTGAMTVDRTMLEWGGKDSSGEPSPSGVYIYQIKCGNSVYNGPVILAR